MSTVDALLKEYGTDIQAASAKAGAVADAFKIDVTRRQIEGTVYVENARMAIEKARLVLTDLQTKAQNEMQALKGGVDFFQSYTSGAVNALGAIVASITSN